MRIPIGRTFITGIRTRVARRRQQRLVYGTALPVLPHAPCSSDLPVAMALRSSVRPAHGVEQAPGKTDDQQQSRGAEWRRYDGDGPAADRRTGGGDGWGPNGTPDRRIRWKWERRN